MMMRHSKKASSRNAGRDRHQQVWCSTPLLSRHRAAMPTLSALDAALINEKRADDQTALMIVSRSGNLRQPGISYSATLMLMRLSNGVVDRTDVGSRAAPAAMVKFLEAGADPDAQSLPNNWERQVTAEPRMSVACRGMTRCSMRPVKAAECTRLLIEEALISTRQTLKQLPLVDGQPECQVDSNPAVDRGGCLAGQVGLLWTQSSLRRSRLQHTAHGGRPDRLLANLSTAQKLLA